MTTASILALSVGLAMDAAAISVAWGFAAQSIRVRDVVKVAAFFGGFQAGMPLIGWFLGEGLGSLVAAWTHWVGFVVLTVLGGKMLRDARSASESTEPKTADPDRVFETSTVFLFAVATSIDALAAGITLPMLDAPLALSLLSIGAVTAALSTLGLVLGQRVGARISGPLGAVGGVVLIALGAKILAQHYGWL